MFDKFKCVIFYSPDYIAARHPFDTTRKAGWIAESLRQRPISGVDIVRPRPLTVGELNEVHEMSYIRAVQTGSPRGAAQQQGFSWDPGIWKMAKATNGGAVAAALQAMTDSCRVSGSLSSGLHHARCGHGAAFCTFNGLALAAKTALKFGAKDVLILDLDAHCGGGTHSLVLSDHRIRHLDISTCDFDSFKSNKRSTSTVVKSRHDYLPAIVQALEILPRFGLCLYNAGMDPFGFVDFDVLRKREQLVFEWARETNTPIAFVLAGGYTGEDLPREGLVDLHRMTIEEAVK
jgi:acetoin utilization deacetylase AcuC-like enzyme